MRSVPPLLSPRKARDQLERLVARLPAEVRKEIGDSVRRLAGAVRNPTDLIKAVPEEMDRLVVSTVPVLARNPLPVSDPLRARLMVAGTAGAAAALQQAGELAVLESLGVSAAALTPAVLTALVSAWVVEVWLAVTVRVEALRRAGREIDEALLGAEIVAAASGGQVSPRRRVTQSLARRGARRLGRRWAAGLVPVVGVAYDGWDAQRTIARITALPVTAHPPVSRSSPGAAADLNPGGS